MLSEYSSTRHAGFRGIHEHVHPAALGSQFLHTQDTQLLSCPRQVLNFHTCKQQYLFLSIYTVFQETALWSVSYVLREKCRNHSHNAGFQSGPSCTPPWALSGSSSKYYACHGQRNILFHTQHQTFTDQSQLEISTTSDPLLFSSHEPSEKISPD
jgi:hypothetical protein